MIEITKDTIIGDILDVAPQTAPIFLSIGMHCLGCPSSRGETVEEACAVHGVDVDKLLALVNEEANKSSQVTSRRNRNAYGPVRMRSSVPSEEEPTAKHLRTAAPAAPAGRHGFRAGAQPVRISARTMATFRCG